MKRIMLMVLAALMMDVALLRADDAVMTVYVSASQGSDKNAGTELAPLQSIRRALATEAREIRLRRGDIFYESVNLVNANIDAYGNGASPMICGLKLLGPKAWTRGEIRDGAWRPSKRGRVWRACLSMGNEHYTGLRTNGSSLLNNIGHIVHLDDDDMLGSRKVKHVADLAEEFDFWQGASFDKDDVDYTAADFDYIYVYSKRNLNKMHLGLAVYQNGVRIENGEIRDIKITHWGRHGISARSNSRILNCEIDGIGGSIQIGYQRWVSLGNGVEYYVTAPELSNGLVSHCTVRRCYDSGLTIQGSSDSKSIRARNIVFENNHIENCCQSMEFFLRGVADDDLYYDCEARRNISVNAGIDTGFRYYEPRYKRCHVLENSFLRRTHMVLRDNRMVNGNYYCAGRCGDKYDQLVWEGNECHIRRGQDLMGDYGGRRDVVTVPVERGEYATLDEATEAAISRYRQLSGDTTTKIVIIEDL